MWITDDRNVLDDWLAVGSAASLAGTSAQQPRTTRLLGAELRLWRAADGSLRCEAGPQPLRIEERYGYLWVCPGGAPARPLFDFPEFAQPGRRIVDCGGIGVATGGLRIVENFLDMAHFPYVHIGYLGKVPHTEVAAYTVKTDADTGEIWATDCRFWQPRASAAAATGIEANYRYRVMQPLSAMLYKSCVPRPGELDAIALFVQPVDEEHSIAHCLLVYYDDTSTDAELIAFQHTIFGQDKPILEGHALRRIPLQGRLEVPTRGDAMSVQYRRWLLARGMRFGVLPA